MSDKSLFNGGARPVLDLATTTPNNRVTSKAENEEIYANLKQANDQRHSKRNSFSSDEDGSDSPRRYRPTLGFREQRSLPTLIACSLLFIGILRLAKAIVTLLQGRNAEDMADRTELCIRAVSDCVPLSFLDSYNGLYLRGVALDFTADCWSSHFNVPLHLFLTGQVKSNHPCYLHSDLCYPCDPLAMLIVRHVGVCRYRIQRGR